VTPETKVKVNNSHYAHSGAILTKLTAFIEQPSWITIKIPTYSLSEGILIDNNSRTRW